MNGVNGYNEWGTMPKIGNQIFNIFPSNLFFLQPPMIAGSADHYMVQKHRYMVKIFGMNECVTLLTDDVGTGCRRGWSRTQGKDKTADDKKESMEHSNWECNGKASEILRVALKGTAGPCCVEKWRANTLHVNRWASYLLSVG